MFLHLRGDFGPEASLAHGLVDHDDPVGPASRVEYALDVHRGDGAEIDDVATDPLGGQEIGRGQRLDRHATPRHERDIRSAPGQCRPPERHLIDRFGDRPLRPEHLLVEYDHHGIVVADCRDRQPLHVARGRRHDRLESGDVGQHGLEALTVLGTGGEPGSPHRGDRQRQRGVAAEHVLELRGLIRELVHRDKHEVHEHQVDDRTESHDCGADAEADDRLLRDRRVDHPALAEPFEEAVEVVEDASGAADILASDEHIRIFVHHLGQTLVERLEVAEMPFGRLGGHQRAPV